MQKTSFIIISSSFIIRKGIASVINTIPNTLIYDELDHTDELQISSPYHIPDFLIVDNQFSDKLNEEALKSYIQKYNVDLILVSGEKNNTPGIKSKLILYFSETEEELKNKLLMNTNIADHLHNKKSNMISEREKNILQMVAKGCTNKEIADKLFISLHTVITHRKNITRKLGIKTVSGLTVYAILNNIIELKEIEQ